jgi:hypothetical protein
MLMQRTTTWLASVSLMVGNPLSMATRSVDHLTKDQISRLNFAPILG